jgi:glutamyl-tRNA reductase
MGIGMSKNLQRYLSKVGSLSLIYTNRTLSRGELLQELSAIPVKTVKHVASKCDIIFSYVSERKHALDYMKWNSHMLHTRSVTMHKDYRRDYCIRGHPGQGVR